MKVAVLWLSITAAVTALVLALPARSFFVGDSGVKLVAARNALAHPARPLNIDLPRIGGVHVGFVDPFYGVHGDHAHAVTSPLFPLLTAPFLTAFGLRGVYVLPAAGLLAALAAIAWVGVRLDPRRSPALLIIVGAICTPLVFYGLEFWEHAPAVAVVAAGTALVAGGRRFAGGLLFGIGVLLRPEAVWYAGAVVVASETCLRRTRSVSEAVIGCARIIAGMAIAVAPLSMFWLLHTGTPLDVHVSANLTPFPAQWTSSRLAILRTWLGSLTAQESLWAVAPAVVLTLIIPHDTGWRGRRFLGTVTLAYVALVVLTAPNDGGGQWGPRYLLLMFVPLTVLIVDALANLARRGRLGAATAVCVVLISVWIQRGAYEELRAAKTGYEGVVGFMEREIAPGGYAVTDLWWLGQVSAALYPDRTFLFAEADADVIRAIQLLDAATASDVTVIRSPSDDADAAILAWIRGTGYSVIARDGFTDLVAWRLTR